MEYIVFDIETTGLDPIVSEIIQIGGIKVKDGIIVSEFSELIKPSVPISGFITGLTGITNEMVKDAEDEITVLTKFLGFIKGISYFMGHNIDDFDIPFINRRLEIHKLGKIRKETIDTLKIAKRKISFRKIENYKLDTLVNFFKINPDGLHRAVNDVKKTWEIYKKLQSYQDEIETCPRCGSSLRLMNGRYGKFIGCSGYPNCKYTQKY